MRHDNFAVFILSHGRPDRVKTLQPLLRGGYTGQWYIVIDNEDSSATEYRKRYGQHVVMFDKLAVSYTFDTADNFQDRRTVVYARNACMEIAEQMGLDYFLQLDDDYNTFMYRFAEDGKLKGRSIGQLDRVFDAMLDFLDDSGALTVAMAQGGDLIGGVNSHNFNKGLLRKAMNTFFFRTDRKFKFLGRINEDVNTYVKLGGLGKLFFTVTGICMTQEQTQSNSGGMTDVYLASGTYLKSFYSVLFCPSCVTVKMMGDKHYRLHHHISWTNAVPMILSEDHKIET